MRRVCTVTGKCPEKFPCVKNADGTLYSEPRPCPYYVRTGLAEVIDWREKFAEAEFVLAARSFQYDDMEWSRDEYADAFDSALAAFEELAGEHQKQREYILRLLQDNAHCQPEQPGPEYSLVRQHWARRRRSKAPEMAPDGADLGTGSDPAIPPQQTKADEARDGTWTDGEGVPEAFIGVTLWECERCHRAVYRLDHECIPAQPEERSG